MKNTYRVARLFFLNVVTFYFRYLKGMNISSGSLVSTKAKLDTTNPRGVHIGNESYIAFGATILTHDFVRDIHVDTYVGSRTFIGANSIVLPGIRIGDNCIIGAGSVVTKDVPSNCIAVGNPARVIRKDIRTTRFGKLVDD
jgi:acetyltransferase-like isoleucine patch superfamily enzyme